MFTREYRINMTAWGISRYAYMELKAFCRQYPEKKAQANALLGVDASSRVEQHRTATGEVVGVAAPRGAGTISDPTANTAMMRERFLRDCDMIDRAAAATDDGEWAAALILNVCYGVGYEYIDPAILPTSNRAAFFRARREFFYRLNAEKFWL